MTTTVTYLFDPLCGWCYGASPAIQKLALQTDLSVALAPTGLFAGGGRKLDADFAQYAWSNDLRIAKLTGQRFTEAYRHNVLGAHGSAFDSAHMALALTAVALAQPQRELAALTALQEARYVQGLDTTSASAVDSVLRHLDLEGPADRLATPDAVLLDSHEARLRQAQTLMRSVGAQGVPALVVTHGAVHRLLGGQALYGDFQHLLAQIHERQMP